MKDVYKLKCICKSKLFYLLTDGEKIAAKCRKCGRVVLTYQVKNNEGGDGVAKENNTPVEVH